jgi:hypothetical protein
VIYEGSLSWFGLSNELAALLLCLVAIYCVFSAVDNDDTEGVCAKYGLLRVFLLILELLVTDLVLFLLFPIESAWLKNPESLRNATVNFSSIDSIV